MRRLTASAPGKLFLAGEHAVTEPGQVAVLVAVDRRLELTLSEAERPAELAGPGWAYVASAARVMGAVAAARGAETPGWDVATRSDLEEHEDGAARKYGLGSSAAVTVAAVCALDAWYGLRLSRSALLRAALLATLANNPTASGGDVATALTGGWLSYACPDRAWVAARQDVAGQSEIDGVAHLVEHSWPGLRCEEIDVGDGVDLAVGWTGAPASTVAVVSAVRAAGMPPAFLAASRRAVDHLVAALRSGAIVGAQDAVREARAGLAALASSTGVEIETPLLRALIEVAGEHGYAAKSSGAGGGDCGIALAAAPGGARREALGEAWVERGIEPLRVSVDQGCWVREHSER